MQQHYILIDNFDPYRAQVVSFDTQGQITQNGNDVVLSSLVSSDVFNDETTSARAHLILSDHLVSAYELDIKAKNRQQLEKAASFAIEDKLPNDLEDYHIVTQKNVRGGASVRCLPKARLEQLLVNCEKLGLTVQSLSIESDLIKIDRSSLLIKEENSCLKTPANHEVLDFDNDVLPLLGERLFSILENESELDLIFAPQQKMLVETLAAQAPDNLRLRQIPRDQEYFSELANAAKQKQLINLLQGDYTASVSESREKNYWLLPSLLALVSGLLFTGGLVAQNLYLSEQVSSQEQELIEAYTERYPSARAPRDLEGVRSRLKSKARSPERSSKTNISHLVLLEKIAAESKQFGIELVGFTFESDQCDLVVNGASVQNINQYKNALTSSMAELGSQSVELTAVNAKDQKYQGKFKLKF